MALPTIAIRCPACGTDLRISLAPSPPTQWFPCPHCAAPVPAVVPRDPPPLYSWEVLPGLYPVLVRPQAPRWRSRPVVAVALAMVVITSLALGGVLAYYGTSGAGPGQYTVSGAVQKSTGGVCCTVALGAFVVLTDDSGATSSQTVSGQGTFDFTGVRSGGITLNITLPGYAPVEVETFAAPDYNAGTTGLVITLVPGATDNGSTLALTPFPNLESFLASIGGGVALLVLVGVVAALAAIVTRRSDRPAVGVVGGGAGVATPVAIYLLGLSSAFPVVVAGAAIVGGFGAFVLTVRAADLVLSGEGPSPG